MKVTAGKYEGDTGTVIGIEDTTVAVFSDVTQSEIKVLITDIQV